jgi:hypothetical protein
MNFPLKRNFVFFMLAIMIAMSSGIAVKEFKNAIR